MKRIKGSNQYVERIQRPVRVNINGVAHKPILLTRLAENQPLGRFQEGAEWFFRKLTLGAMMVFFMAMGWTLAVEGLGRAMAAPMVVEVPMESKSVPPILRKIAQCESSGKQFNSKGEVVTSRTGDKGMYQISPKVWGSKAKSLGYDLNTLAGNEAMARYIFNNKGSAPWVASSKCWNR